MLQAAMAACDQQGNLTQQGHQGLGGVMRQAADWLRNVLGPVAIPGAMLAMVTSQMGVGMPNMMGLPMGFGMGGGMGTNIAAAGFSLAQMALSAVFGNGSMFGNGMGFGSSGFMPMAMPWNMNNIFNSASMMTNRAVLGSGFIPTGNGAFDLTNAFANQSTLFSSDEQALMMQIKDPAQIAAMTLQKMQQRNALLNQTLSAIMEMHHETLKQYIQNLRA
jgi:hypothetical protein